MHLDPMRLIAENARHNRWGLRGVSSGLIQVIESIQIETHLSLVFQAFRELASLASPTTMIEAPDFDCSRVGVEATPLASVNDLFFRAILALEFRFGLRRRVAVVYFP